MYLDTKFDFFFQLEVIIMHLLFTIFARVFKIVQFFFYYRDLKPRLADPPQLLADCSVVWAKQNAYIGRELVDSVTRLQLPAYLVHGQPTVT